MTGRIVIEDIRPRTPNPGYAAKATIGEAVPVRAVIFRDGHDVLAARVELWQDGARAPSFVVPLVPTGNDEWQAEIVPDRIGRHYLALHAWTDRQATWARNVQVKLDAGQEIDVEVAEGDAMVEAVLKSDPGLAGSRALEGALTALRDTSLSPERRVAPALSAEVAALLSDPHWSPDLTAAPPQPLWVDRPRALFGSWYELFPRSYGGFQGVVERVPALAAMGFDVLYLPPIHPIGTTHRKGRNNALVPEIDAPGSPWAIGSPGGGHTSIDPALGTIEDFHQLRAVASQHGMEVALDYALQCSPDHPWVAEHPEWFHRRPDGSIAFAENPPKKYQDIFPLNFWPEREQDRAALWLACSNVLRFWIDQGVRIFRVDNPHTKPIAFWEWLIPAIQVDHPDVIFLAEAFTRPHVMSKLAEVGFTQSYTYFTWRTTQHGEEGLVTYLEELAHGPAADYMRPNFWPNTPDILAGPLRNGPPAAFALRAVLAATMSPSYGIYSGYELYENEPASPDNEEYLDSEKYQIRRRAFDRPGTLAPLLAELNQIRQAHPALQRLRSIRFWPSDNPEVIAYSKRSDDGADVVLVVVTLNPLDAQETLLHLDLAALGLPADRPFPVRDELSGDTYAWHGPTAFVRLEPWTRVAHILDLRARELSQ
ncbi:MAG: alpha-1,4-glucan--maltose-1-phosphate maltosyltransferase [Acidimicrobiaceae bacterium]|nr:alpha-1,4-glucan--maltose-1-phosphate maltosyltransferase [Acidimicrobiaceae bacterium]